MKRLVLISACIVAASGAFAQAQCVKTEVSLTGNQMTLTTSGAKTTTSRETYVYYEKKRHRKHDKLYAVPGSTANRYPSKPLMLNNSMDVSPVPEQYNVSVSAPQGPVTACPDSALDVAATLSVERVASYTGNYPGTKDEPVYRKVSKRQYKMAARKKRKIERKEAKIARRAHVNVEVKSTTV